MSMDFGVQEVLEKFPAFSFKLIPEKGWYFKGPFHVADPTGIYENTFQLEIIWFSPYRYPFVFETGGYIPRTIDFHVYPKTGNLCIKGIPEEIWECRYGLSLLKFLEGTMKNLLIHHIFRKEEGYFIQERSHGQLGALESMCDLLKIKEPNHLEIIVKAYLGGTKVPSNQRCICSSGKLFRNCCAERWKKLSIFKPEFLNQFLT